MRRVGTPKTDDDPKLLVLYETAAKLLASETIAFIWSDNMSLDMQGRFERGPANFPEGETIDSPLDGSYKICEGLRQAARILLEDAATYYTAYLEVFGPADDIEKSNIDLSGTLSPSEVFIPSQQAEVLMAQAKYCMRTATLREQLLTSGRAEDDLEFERAGFREKVDITTFPAGRFYIDLGPDTSLDVIDTTHAVRQLLGLARLENIDLIGLHVAHPYAIQHNRDSVLWTPPDDIDLELNISSIDISDQFITLEQWLTDAAKDE